MSLQQIQILMNRLSKMHNTFQQKGYQLSELDKQSIKNSIEQLNIELLITTNAIVEPINITPAISEPIEQPITEQPTRINTVEPSPPQTVLTETSQPVEDVNNEIDELFFPKNEIHKESKQSNFQLGINERIMFARELFNNDVIEMQTQIRKLQQFSNKNEALHFFDNQYAPNLLQQGKEEEIINEFRTLVQRMY